MLAIFRTRPLRRRLRQRASILVGLFLAVAGSCTETTGPGGSPARVTLQPQFEGVTGAASLPVTLTRLTARDAVTNAVLETETVPANPPGDQQNLEFSVPVMAATSAVVTAELIHVTAGLLEIVQYSGVTPQFMLTPGSQSVQSITIRPGPLDNLSVTAIQITDVPAMLLQGQTAQLRAVVSAPIGTNPRVFWSTSNATVLQVDNTGVIMALQPGTARITAAAGTVQGSADVRVESQVALFTILTGSDQTGSAGSVLSEIPTVLVRGSSGEPLSGITVSFAIRMGGGSIERTSVVTNESGIVQAGAWTLGTTPGVNTLEASVPSQPAVPILVFQATGNPGAAASFVAVSGDNQTGNAGQQLAAPLVVRVTDAFGNPVPNVVVTFAAATGTASPSSATTNASGEASTSWTIGTTPGLNTLEASVPSEPALPILVFHATGQQGPATKLEIVSGNNQTGDLGQPLASPLVVRATDQFGNPVPGVYVTFGTWSGTGTASPPSTLTNASGEASTQWTLGTTRGHEEIRAYAWDGATVLASVVFSAIAALGPQQMNLDIVQSSIQIWAPDTLNFTVRLRSGTNPLAAPAGGLQVSLAAVAPSCAAVPATATIPEGSAEVVVPVMWSGNGSLPCNTMVHATAANILPDSVAVNIVRPNLGYVNNVDPATIGAGLQRAFTVYVSGSGKPRSVRVHLASSDGSLLLLAPNDSTVGTTTLDLTIPPSTRVTFYAQAPGPYGTATLTMSSPDAIGAVTQINIVQPTVEARIPATMTTMTPDVPIYARLYVGPAREPQGVRGGAPPLIVTLESQDPSVATLVTTSGTAATQTVAIAPGEFESPRKVAAGRVALHAVSAGSTAIRATAPGFISTESTVTVTAPELHMGPFIVGAGLRKRYSTIVLGGASNHGGVTVRIESSDPSRVLLSRDSTDAPAAFIDLPIANGEPTGEFAIHAIEGPDTNVLLTASAPGFTGTTGTVQIVRPAIELRNVVVGVSTSSPDNAIYVRLGVASNISFEPGLMCCDLQDVRPGGPGFTITFTTSNNAVATLVTNAGTAASVTIPLTTGNTTPMTVAEGGVAVRPLTPGSTTISATAPGVTSTRAATVTVNVRSP